MPGASRVSKLFFSDSINKFKEVDNTGRSHRLLNSYPTRRRGCFAVRGRRSSFSNTQDATETWKIIFSAFARRNEAPWNIISRHRLTRQKTSARPQSNSRRTICVRSIRPPRRSRCRALEALAWRHADSSHDAYRHSGKRSTVKSSSGWRRSATNNMNASGSLRELRQAIFRQPRP